MKMLVYVRFLKIFHPTCSFNKNNNEVGDLFVWGYTLNDYIEYTVLEYGGKRCISAHGFHHPPPETVAVLSISIVAKWLLDLASKRMAGKL